jgi:serine/threonine-protein kinase
MPAPPIIAGQVVAGKYELKGRLGSGSMGEVWRGHHRTLGEDVAIKFLTSEPSSGEVEDSSTATARFRFEAQVAARLSRKTRHIVRVTDHGEEDGLAYLVMELLEGQTLETRLAREGCMRPFEARALVTQVARALTEAHTAGVIHRDLKPANIFLTRDEEGELLVKLLDFGIARTIHTHRVAPSFATAAGLVFGTPGYMSPEQASPTSKLDHRCDLWALATVAYEALTGELPVAGATTGELLGNLCAGRIVPLHERNPGLPATLAAFFQQAFAISLEERHSSASELAQAFDRAANEKRSHGKLDGMAIPLPSTLKGRAYHVTVPVPIRGRPIAGAPGSPSGGPLWLKFVAPASLLLSVAALTGWTALPSSPTGEPPTAIVKQAGAPMERAESPPPAAAVTLEQPAESAPLFAPATQPTAPAPSGGATQSRPPSDARVPSPPIAPPSPAIPPGRSGGASAESSSQRPAAAGAQPKARKPLDRDEVL